MSKRFLSHWRGVLLSLIGIVATLWLAATGQLGLYIHPRYFVFTTVMGAIAAALVICAFAVVPRTEAEPHEEDEEKDPSPRGRRWWVVGNAVAIAGCAGALLVLPPATLATSALEQRDINGSVGQSADAATTLIGGDSSTFTVKDWAILLRQGVDASILAQEQATLLGFVTPDPDDPENVFYVARFVVTCCAVDAQPVGVPVYDPGWQQRHPVDEWVSVTGGFIGNPSVLSAHPVVLKASEITPTAAPAEPYVY